MDRPERLPREEEKEASDFLRRALARSPVAIVRLRADDLTPTWASANFERVTGLPRETFMTSDDGWRDWLHPEDRSRIVKALRELAEDEVEEIDEAVRFDDPTGSYSWYRMVTYPESSGKEPAHLLGFLGEITTRKEFERRLRESRRRHREAQRMARVGNWEWFPDDGDVYWSDEEYRIFGYEPDEVEPSYEAFRRRVHPEDRKRIDRVKRSVLRGEDSFETEFRVVHPDERVRWVREQGRVEEDERRASRRMVGVTQDVTEQVEARRAAEQAEEKWATVVDVAPVGIAITDPDTNHILSANQRFANYLGYTQEEFVGKTVGELDHWDDPERHREVVERIREHGEVRNELVAVRDRGGDLKYGHLSVRSLELDGRECWLQVSRDVTPLVEQQEKLRQSEQRYRELFDHNVAGVFRSTPDGTLLECNQSLADMMGYDTPEELEGRDARMLYPSGDDRDEYLDELLEQGEVINEELQLRNRDGSPVWVLENSFVSEDPETGDAIIQGTLTDITDRKRAEERLRESEERYRRLFWHNKAGIVRTQVDGEVLSCNPAGAEMFGYDEPGEFVGRSITDHYRDEDERAEMLRRLEEDGELLNYELSMERRDGSPLEILVNFTLSRRVEGSGQVVIGNCIEVTDQIELRRELEEMAYRDPLTGLGNRRMLGDQASRFLSLAERRDRYTGLAYMDLDRFKEVNDRWGHEMGDEVLREVAERLRSQSREADLVVRLGGDEFVVLLADLDDPEDVLTATRRLTASFDAPVSVDEQVIAIDVSVGVSAFPVDGDDLDSLLRRADRALHRAKERGGRIARYQPETDVSLAEASRLDREVREGLEAGEFLLHYQPIVTLPEREAGAAEALVRWQHPERGLLEASDFVPQAERSGVIREIDKWVVEEAIRQLGEWQETGDGPQAVSLNLSALSFRDPSVLRHTSTAIREARLEDPSGLMVEVTETEVMKDPAVTMELLRGFRETGIRVALDDFGTGHSSLSYLDQFPVDLVKLDRRFVSKIGEARGEDRLVRAMIELANNLALDITAEGVETEDHLEWLTTAGCGYAQGFLLGEPVPAEEITWTR